MSTANAISSDFLQLPISTEQITTLTNELKSLLKDQIENNEPQDSILKWLKENAEGKRVDKRLKDKLAIAFPDINLQLGAHYPGTTLTWGNYYNSGGKTGECLYISRNEKNVYIDTKQIEEENARYFRALEDRNERRLELLRNYLSIRELAVYILCYKYCSDKLHSCIDDNFSVDKYSIEEKYGLKS